MTRLYFVQSCHFIKLIAQKEKNIKTENTQEETLQGFTKIEKGVGWLKKDSNGLIIKNVKFNYKFLEGKFK